MIEDNRKLVIVVMIITGITMIVCVKMVWNIIRYKKLLKRMLDPKDPLYNKNIGIENERKDKEKCLK